MNTNILYHEATFSETLAEKAAETGHSTSADAARVANEAQTKLLVIGHFSARYTNPFVLLREAREKFFPAWLATELRPIYTNPSQEKGIVQQKVYMKEVSDKSSGSDGGGKKKRSGGSKSDRSNKRFRKRKGSSSDRKRKKRSSSDSNNERRRKRSDRNKSDNNDNQGSSRPPKHITPRTPFDNFDRF